MKIVLSKLPRKEEKTVSYKLYWDGWFETVYAYLSAVNRFFLVNDKPKLEWWADAKYNDFYHFYEVTIFGDKNIKRVQTLIDYFTNEGYDVSLHHSWAWVYKHEDGSWLTSGNSLMESKKINGLRIWIKAKELT